MKKISIEALLTWAFAEELPKVGTVEGGPSAAPSTWGVLSDVITLGTMVDRSPNCYGVISSFAYDGEPHADALIVGDAVRSLAARTFEIGAGWYPFPEWEDPQGLVRTEVERIAQEQVGRNGRLNGRHVVSLVSTAAILKRGPDWHCEEPKTVMVTNGGKPAWFVTRRCKDRTGATVLYEDNGFDQRKQRPRAGAYRKYRLAQSVRGSVLARLDWQLWQSALEELHDVLKCRLQSHDLVHFYPNRQPWLTMRKQQAESQVIDIAAE